MKKKILIIAAHPDDETIGCGGTIARHAYNGDEVGIITLTDGVNSRNNFNDEDVERRSKAAKNAMKRLNAKWITSGNFPDNQIDSVPLIDVIKFIESYKKAFYPDIIYVHSPSDLNIDHRIAASATLTAYRPQPSETYSEIRFYEVSSSTDYNVKQLEQKFAPNLYINIDNFWKNKLEALNEYDIEIHDDPHSRSYKKIKSLAEFRGSESGMQLAEAFEVVRRIIR